MSINDIELTQILSMTGLGKMPVTGGPAGLLLSPISQTIPIERASSGNSTSSGVMSLSPIHIAIGQKITNINFMNLNQAEATGTHLWFALYDDGRGSTTAGQLALLGQTADQTGSAAFGLNVNLGLSLIMPYTTTYSGIYYVAYMCAASTVPFVRGSALPGSVSISLGSSAGCLLGGTAGSGLLNLAPNPSGTVSAAATVFYAYVS